MIDVLEMETGAVTAFINGPEGDVGPRLTNGRTTGVGKIAYAMRHGAFAGQDAVRVYKNLGSYSVPELKTYGGKYSAGEAHSARGSQSGAQGIRGRGLKPPRAA